LGLVGEESTGKTFYVLAAVRAFLDADPENAVIYFESESALTTEIIEGRGIDTKRLLVLPVATVQEFKNQCLRIVDRVLEERETNPKLLVILDSLGNLSTTKEMDDSAKGAETRDMTRAQVIKAAFRVLSLKLGAARIPMIFTNHVYDNIGSFIGGHVQSGGKGSKYAASVIIGLTKAKHKDGEKHDGSVISATTVKSRLTREGMKVKTLIRFDGGLDRYYGLIDLAEKAGIFKKVSTRYLLPDREIKVFGKAIERNPEKYFTDAILQQIETYVQQNFRYGVASVNDLNEESAEDENE
jgi:RecA/RadA recombinase